MQEAYGILDKFKISRTFFVRTDQEGCALAASDINAANGITAESTVAEATGTDQKKLPILTIKIPVQSEEESERQNAPVLSPVVAAFSNGIPQQKDANEVNETPSTEQEINSTTETYQVSQR